MRDAFRSGDMWLAHSRRYGDVKRALVPIEAAHATARLAVPYEPQEWLAERKGSLVEGLDHLADAAHHGRIPGGAIENGELRIGRPASAVPEDVDEARARPLSSPARGADHRYPAGGGRRHRFHQRFHAPAHGRAMQR